MVEGMIIEGIDCATVWFVVRGLRWLRFAVCGMTSEAPQRRPAMTITSCFEVACPHEGSIISIIATLSRMEGEPYGEHRHHRLPSVFPTGRRASSASSLPVFGMASSSESKPQDVCFPSRLPSQKREAMMLMMLAVRLAFQLRACVCNHQNPKPARNAEFEP